MLPSRLACVEDSKVKFFDLIEYIVNFTLLEISQCYKQNEINLMSSESWRIRKLTIVFINFS